PIWFCATAGNTRRERWQQARNGGEVARVFLSLRSKQRGFFAKYQAIHEEKHAEAKHQKSGPASQKSESGREEKIPQIKRIANVTERPLGDELLAVKRLVKDDRAMQIGFGPRTDQCSDDHEQGSDGEGAGNVMAETR